MSYLTVAISYKFIRLQFVKTFLKFFFLKTFKYQNPHDNLVYIPENIFSPPHGTSSLCYNITVTFYCGGVHVIGLNVCRDTFVDATNVNQRPVSLYIFAWPKYTGFFIFVYLACITPVARGA